MANSSLDLNPIPVVNAAIFNEHREILLTRRSPLLRQSGKWCLPGGHIEIGETWVNAVRREIAEEVGLRIKEERLLGIYSDPLVTLTEENQHFVAAVFEVIVFEGEVTPNEEVDLWGWFSLKSLPEPMLKSHPVRVADAFTSRTVPFVR